MRRTNITSVLITMYKNNKRFFLTNKLLTFNALEDCLKVLGAKAEADPIRREERAAEIFMMVKSRFIVFDCLESCDWD